MIPIAFYCLITTKVIMSHSAWMKTEISHCLVCLWFSVSFTGEVGKCFTLLCMTLLNLTLVYFILWYLTPFWNKIFSDSQNNLILCTIFFHTQECNAHRFWKGAYVKFYVQKVSLCMIFNLVQKGLCEGGSGSLFKSVHLRKISAMKGVFKKFKEIM